MVPTVSEAEDYATFKDSIKRGVDEDLLKFDSMTQEEREAELIRVNKEAEDKLSLFTQEEREAIRAESNRVFSMTPEERDLYEEAQYKRTQERWAKNEVEMARIDAVIKQSEVEIAQAIKEFDIMVAEAGVSSQPILDLPSVSDKAYSPSSNSNSLHGMLNNKIQCPQCNERGYVHTRKVNKKSGISGGKATAALLTVGISLFFIGLSRTEKVTSAYCENCKSEWNF